MSKRAIVELIKNGRVVGWAQVTPAASTGLLWRHIGNEPWIDSPDIEIDFDESQSVEDMER